MPLIEGVGDEVVQFVAVILVIVVAALAWWSTNARPDRYRTVLVMRSRVRHPLTVSITTRPNMVGFGMPNATSTPITSSDPVGSNSSEGGEERVRENTRVIPLQEMDSIVDADMAMINHHRLHFYRRIDSPSGNQSGAESTSDESETADEGETGEGVPRDQIQEMDSIVSAMEADVAADPFRRSHEGSPPNTENITNTEEPSEDLAAGDARKIQLKLKYLNDTLKEVEGSLDELLKDFKWRHFSTELSSSCRVRLIFKGRVLDDAATLQACGLHDQAVLHCLVHPSRPQAQRVHTEEPTINATHELITEAVQPERTWDLENILMTLVSIALTVVWFFRCEYSNMFTASASVALFGLTVFYSVAIFGLYLSDTFHFDRRAHAQPVPTN